MADSRTTGLRRIFVPRFFLRIPDPLGTEEVRVELERKGLIDCIEADGLSRFYASQLSWALRRFSLSPFFTSGIDAKAKKTPRQNMNFGELKTDMGTIGGRCYCISSSP